MKLFCLEFLKWLYELYNVDFWNQTLLWDKFIYYSLLHLEKYVFFRQKLFIFAIVPT